MSDKPLRVAPTHGIEHREIARLTAEVERLGRSGARWRSNYFDEVKVVVELRSVLRKIARRDCPPGEHRAESCPRCVAEAALSAQPAATGEGDK
jgi:hypothetical protein